MAAFRAELQKAHRRHDLLLCLLLPGIVVLWVGGLSPSSPEELANGYSALLYSIPVIEAILLPVMMAVLACRLWDMEVKGNTAKLLYTLQTRRSLFAGKAVFGTLEVLLTAVLELACVPVLRSRRCAWASWGRWWACSRPFCRRWSATSCPSATTSR